MSPSPVTAKICEELLYTYFFTHASSHRTYRFRTIKSPQFDLETELIVFQKKRSGVIFYHEQVLRIANEFAGFDLAEADLLRRAMSHFDPGKRMQEHEGRRLIRSAGDNVSTAKTRRNV